LRKIAAFLNEFRSLFCVIIFMIFRLKDFATRAIEFFCEMVQKQKCGFLKARKVLQSGLASPHSEAAFLEQTEPSRCERERGKGREIERKHSQREREREREREPRQEKEIV